MQRAASLMPLPPLLAEFGVSMESVLEGTGISSSALGPASFIPYSVFLKILDNSAMATGRDDIGMLLGRRQTLAALGPLGKLVRHAATLGEALTEFVAFQINNSTGGAVYLLRADRDVMLGYGVYNPSVRISHHIYDLVLAVGCNLIAELTGGAVGPEEILLSRAPPSNPAPYRRLGRCSVHFDQNQTAILLGASALTFPLPEASIVLHREARAKLVSALEMSREELCGHVRHLLRPHLLMGQARMEDLAGRLELHPRTMRRRLRQEGTTFEAIKDEVRFTAARELLMLGALDIADIALTLDYSSVSSFVHAFRRWSGKSPGLWRETEAWRNVQSFRASPALLREKT
jgi:AraC-like DNA-binding protein